MSGQMSEDEARTGLSRLDVLVRMVGEIQQEIQGKTLEFEEATRPLKQEFETSVDELAVDRDKLMAEISSLTTSLIAGGAIKGSSTALRSGTVAIRKSTSVVVDSEDELMRMARRIGIVKQVSEPKPRRVNKSMLSNLLKSRPDLAKILGVVVRKDTKHRLTVTPKIAQAEVSRELSPLQVRVIES